MIGDLESIKEEREYNQHDQRPNLRNIVDDVMSDKISTGKMSNLMSFNIQSDRGGKPS